LKITHVNTHMSGGAARAAQRLHDGLCRLGCDSRLFTKFGNVPAQVRASRFRTRQDLMIRVISRLRRDRINRSFAAYASTRPPGLELFSDDRSECGRDVVRQLPDCDLVNLHWVAGFVDYAALFASISKPIVWTLHDMNPFTGGCHYNGGCKRFHDRCGECPQLGSENRNDLSHAILQRKARAYAGLKSGQMHIVTPSRWLKKEAQASSLFAALPVSVIPNGLDTSIFLPRDAAGMKSALGIPEHASLVLFAADSIGNARKGFSLLMNAVSGMPSSQRVFFLSVGGGEVSCLGEDHIHLGSIDNDILMSAIYSLADLFVIPSLEDNLPNTVLESMACGTPVVGFDLGGIPDMIRPGQTGQLVKAKDVSGLREAIMSLLHDRAALERMGTQCRTVAVAEYDLGVQAKRYMELYSLLLEGAG